MKKQSKSLSKFLSSILLVVAIIGISLSNVSAASQASPWDYSSTPQRAIYYKKYTSVMKGNDVKWVQQALNITVNANLDVDGSFGPACKTAVISFQRKYALSKDGSFGPGTRSKMVSVLNTLGYSDSSTSHYNLIWPTESRNITGMYGEKASRRDSGRRYHSGIDIGSSIGDEVYSTAAGKVIFKDYSDARGNYVVVYHKALGISSIYEHLKTTKVSNGQAVWAGQPIATSGNTGITNGKPYPSHLHFGIIKGKVTSLRDDLWYVNDKYNNKTLEPDPRYNNNISYSYQ